MRWYVTAVALCALLPAAARACECCARNATAAECGADARLEARRDCACCSVCAVQKGGACDDSDRPCQEGLECSSQGVCTDEKTCRSDGECASDRFCLGGVCFDPCTILDPCNNSLKNGVCRTRNHRPVCSCPPGFSFQAESNACVKVGCEDEGGSIVDVGERVFRKDCQETCVCSPGGKFNCTPTACPPGYYRTGTFRNDPECTELRGSAIAGGCCVNVVCSGLGSPSADGVATDASTAEEESATTAAPPIATLDMLPLDITHNTTTLQLPAAGGQLSYRAAGRASQEVPLEASRRVVTVGRLQPGTSYTFRWQGDAGTKTLTVDTRPGCVTNTSSHAIGETYHMGCQSTCVCGGPNQPSCRPRCSFTRGTVTDLSCSERPDLDDPECCVQLVCAVTSTGEQRPRALLPPSPAADQQPKPTLIVTTKSYNSATLAWDDFKPPAYARGYVAQYRRTGGGEWRRQELPPQPGQSVPLMKIGDLVPRTEYEARVAIYDSRDQDTLGDTTETIRFVTDDGCVDGNSTYPVGGQFYRECEETCFCELRGKVRCVPRCQRPMFRQGAFKDDPLCFEKKMDECCVIVACSSEAQDVDAVVEADGSDPCDSVLCDENYVCEVMTKEASDVKAGDVTAVAMCVCPPGFREEKKAGFKACRPETKTTPAVVPQTGCTYGNATYRPGDEFFDGCEFRCMCNSDEEVECKARCASEPDPEASLAAGCRVMTDPADSCCKKTVCDTDTTTESAIGATTVPSSELACEADGRQYAVNSTFERGCDTCLCQEGGELFCKSSSELKLLISDAVLDSILSANTQPLIVEWRYDDSSRWQAAEVGVDEFSVESLDTLVMKVEGLQRPRQARVRVSYAGETSAVVRGGDVVPTDATLPPPTEAETTTEACACVHLGVCTLDDGFSLHVTIPEDPGCILVQDTKDACCWVESCQEEVKEEITHLAAPIMLREEQKSKDESEAGAGETTTMATMTEETTETTEKDPMVVMAEMEKASSEAVVGEKENLAQSEASTTEASSSDVTAEDELNEINVASAPAAGTAKTKSSEKVTKAAVEDADSAPNTIDSPPSTTEATTVEMAQSETPSRDGVTTGPAETSTFASTLVSQVPSKPPTAAGAAGERTTTSSPETTTAAQETPSTTDLSNVIEINLTGLSGGLDEEEVKALNNAIVEAMEDEIATEKAAASEAPTIQPTTERSGEVEPPAATATESYDDLLATGSSMETTTVTMDGATIGPTEPTKIEETKSEGGREGAEFCLRKRGAVESTTIETPVTEGSEEAVTEAPAVSTESSVSSEGLDVVREEFKDELLSESDALTLNSTEPPEEIALDGAASGPPGSETTTDQITDQTTDSPVQPVSSTITTRAVVTSTTPRTVPTTRRITGLITFAPIPGEEPSSTTRPAEPTEAPRPGGLAPSDFLGETVPVAAAAALESTPAPEVTTLRPEGCLHDGKLYKVGDEFHDGCRQFCICGQAGKMCAPIRCPVRFGLDLLNPDCLEWEVPRDPSRQPPDCCGEAVCKDDGHCIYQGQKFRNQYEIPQNLTGCHQRCYCEFGEVNCQPDCPAVPDAPPAGLPCPPEQTELVTGPNGCCQFWQCAQIGEYPGRRRRGGVHGLLGRVCVVSVSGWMVVTLERALSAITCFLECCVI
ncbi:putative epidermal cell surface receptor [Amphibalanus amphitrite]|uniref:Putative epidermal cell surface receptor n=1 Tax=Amphibalanus amphitrite TaxID=1232801 RepID=A0A6A4V9R4_AMPAM|nr:putative epidermal cell surface receptor [Amphibalanus amphitrite]